MVLLVSKGGRQERLLELGQLPATVGRGASAGVRISEQGVWDEHCTLRLDGLAVMLEPREGANTSINDVVVRQATRLRNGDQLSFGGAKFTFELASPTQRSARPREVFAWALVGLVSAAQLLLLLRYL